ncbi:hypothetical protein EI555_001986 [Monodon monoceros]|uniref:Pentraxin (PTX) domain-containing protein n=1 Tax=Monodon monoceros TaxID=40151 RepID=A0A4U1FFC4_MONMO|nr:hypothetical protein EI555_001986 [Monodon monoceros]
MVCKEEMNQRMPASRLKTGLSKSLPGTSDMGGRDQSHISTLSVQCALNPQLHSLDNWRIQFVPWGYNIASEILKALATPVLISASALVSGKTLVRKGLWQRPFVGAHPKTVLGQEQDSFGNGFHKGHSLWK